MVSPFIASRALADPKRYTSTTRLVLGERPDSADTKVLLEIKRPQHTNVCDSYYVRQYNIAPIQLSKIVAAIAFDILMVAGLVLVGRFAPLPKAVRIAFYSAAAALGVFVIAGNLVSKQKTEKVFLELFESDNEIGLEPCVVDALNSDSMRPIQAFLDRQPWSNQVKREYIDKNLAAISRVNLNVIDGYSSYYTSLINEE